MSACRRAPSVADMDDFATRQTELIDRSGLGLLPGLTLALVIALCFVGAITLHTWWAVGLALAGAVGGTVVVVIVVLKTVLSGDDHERPAA
jgi:hypothetical protein